MELAALLLRRADETRGVAFFEDAPVELGLVAVVPGTPTGLGPASLARRHYGIGHPFGQAMLNPPRSPVPPHTEHSGTMPG